MLDAGDIAAVAGAGTGGVALILSAAAGVAAWKSLRWEQVSAESARRSAEAAERANLLTERALLQGVPTTPREHDEVSWTVTHSSGNRYVLRNTGTTVAEHVKVESTGGIARNLPTDAVIRPGEGVDILLLGTFGSSIPNQLYVSWGESADQVAVPISN